MLPFLKILEFALNASPVGFVEGLIHYIALETERKNRPLKAAKNRFKDSESGFESTRDVKTPPADNDAAPSVETDQPQRYVPTIKVISRSFGSSAIFDREENGLLSDSYVDATVTQYNRNVKIFLLMERLKQKPGILALGEAYHNVESREELIVDSWNYCSPKLKYSRRQCSRWDNSPFSNYSWIYVKMPRQFNYTGVIMLNAPFQGLLHSFIRHSDDWQHYIYDVKGWLNEISNFEDQLKNVREANNEDSSIKAIKEFVVARRELPYQRYICGQEAAMNAQMKFHRFIHDNITYENYLGEGVNLNCKEQVFFEVKNNLEERQVMVVSVSDQLFPVNADFPDSRQLRTITSVFFISMQDYGCRKIMKKF